MPAPQAFFNRPLEATTSLRAGGRAFEEGADAGLRQAALKERMEHV